MKIKLHNKYEIKIGGQTYIAYNTLLNTIYDKISNLEQYTSHIAIGTGTTEKVPTDTNLSNYLMSFKAETEEIQSDVSQDTLFIKKVVTIDESNTNTFSFSEIGITNTSEFDPIIFNHVLLKNQDGEVVSLTRNQGDVMEIRVTIYLELNAESKSLFVNGENDLIKQILGEELNISDNNLYAVRGENILTSEYSNNLSPDLSNKIQCDKNIITNDNGSISINFSAELGEGNTEEILLVYNDKVCLRVSTLEFNEPKNITKTFSCEPSNLIEVDEYIKEIQSVSSVDGTVHSNHSVVNYSKKLTDKINNLFDQSFTNTTPRYISKDGQMIAFNLNSYLHLYRYENYDFIKINTTQVDLSNLFKLFMFENIILILRTQEPYIDTYIIENDCAIKKSVSLSMYDASVYSYDWLDAEATLTYNNKILIGVIINDENKTPVVIKLTPNTEGNYTDDFSRPTIETAKKIYSIYKNNYVEPRICFITDTYAGGTYYLIEEISENETTFSSNSDIAYSLLNNTVEIQTSGRCVLSQKTSSPYLIVYYYPNFENVDNDFSIGIKHYTSKDGNYIISKISDGNYKIYNFHTINNLTEFEAGFPSYVDLTSVLDFEFVGDLLLVFTSNTSEPLYAIALKNIYTRIENLSDTSSSYVVNYIKYDILGSKALEGVKINFNINFGINEEI